MLALIKNKLIINTILIIVIILISVLSIHWHNEMFKLHKQENIVKTTHERINALNRQLRMQYSELQSGIMIYEKARNELRMIKPPKEKIQGVSI